MSQFSAPKKYHPKGFELLYEDLDLIIGNKAAGFLTVPAAWSKSYNIQNALDEYVRKGSAKSKKVIYVVHRLDQATTGILVFAKTEAAQQFLKNNWLDTQKTYFAVVHGHLSKKTGLIESFLTEDEEYVVKSNENSEGKLAKTEYEVLAEAPKFSLVKINLLTGRKNQIRVHFADIGHPLVGDAKYGSPDTPHKYLALHARSIELTHPHTKKRMTFEAKVPVLFRNLVDYEY